VKLKGFTPFLLSPVQQSCYSKGRFEVDRAVLVSSIDWDLGFDRVGFCIAFECWRNPGDLPE
jgi:hypothetical protein